MEALPADISTLIGTLTDDYAVVAERSWTRRGDAAVWEVWSGNGRCWYAKRHASAIFHARETRAYREWAPALGEGTAPVLAAADADALVIVTTALPGQPVRGQRLKLEEEAALYCHAGAVLSRLHSIPAAPPAPGKPWPVRVRETIEAAAPLLSADDVALVRRLTAEPPPDFDPVPCHGDFTARNWHWSPEDAFFGVCDFERAEVEPAASRDLMRMEYRIFPRAPHLREPFYEGYGRGLNDAERRACVPYAALDAASALRWGTEHRDEETIGHGRTALDRLRAEAGRGLAV